MMNQINFNRVAKNQEEVKKKLEKNEVHPLTMQIETRILKLLHESDLVDLNEFRF